MNKNTIIGAAVLIGGIALAVYGFNIQDSFKFRFNDFFGAENPASSFYIVGGILSAIVGLVLVLRKSAS